MQREKHNACTKLSEEREATLSEDTVNLTSDPEKLTHGDVDRVNQVIKWVTHQKRRAWFAKNIDAYKEWQEAEYHLREAMKAERRHKPTQAELEDIFRDE